MQGSGKRQMALVKRYNLNWNDTYPEWLVEADMVLRGGQFEHPKQKGIICGNGTEWHYKRMMALLWPSVVWHKWNNLIVKEYLTHETLAILGPASSGKTHTVAMCVLADYYLRPFTTTVVVCSTTIPLLEQRIWGEMKALHKHALSHSERVPGNLIEGKRRIVSDGFEEVGDGRDFRNGCFPAGTLVDTPSGSRPIEQLRVGDAVINAAGIGRIKECHVRTADRLIRVWLSDGRIIDCTSEHPFFTARGWVPAIDLGTSDTVLSVNETLPLLQTANASRLSQPEILQRPVSEFSTPETMQKLSRYVPPVEPPGTLGQSSPQWRFLQHNMRGKVGRKSPRMFEEVYKDMPSLWEDVNQRAFLAGVLLSEMSGSTDGYSLPPMRTSVHFDSGFSKEAEDETLQHGLQAQGDWKEEWQTAGPTDTGRTGGVETFPGIHKSIPLQDRKKPIKRFGSLVPDGHCFSGPEIRHRDRWRSSQHSKQASEGHRTNQNIGGARVDRVEVLESRSDPRFDEGEGGYRVYNFEVAGHPSYSVSGVIVHNCVGLPCKHGENFVGLGDFAGIKNRHVRFVGDELSLLPRVFVDAIANLAKNDDFKAVGLGNPKDTTDALGVLAEPAAAIGGWDSNIDQVAQTKTWATRRPNGVCVQLVGTDSPNIKGDLGIPLITQKHIDSDIAFYGKDSLQFTMMNMGMMPKGQGSRRVITRNLVEKFHARDEPVWASSDKTKIGCLDAAYRGVGGDRCVLMFLEYGPEASDLSYLGTRVVEALINQTPDQTNRPVIIALVDTIIVPIRAAIKDDPEDQIATFVMNECESRGIPPENFFYDSGMRTSLVQSFARLWSANTNSIDCGGQPSDRKVSWDIDILCRDYYSKRITELWYNVRYIIEAGQFRGMTDDVMMEGCAREWTKVAGNKIEVEPKEKMKLKTGRSPDLFDCLAVGCWGAISKGFVIRRSKSAKRALQDDSWKDDMRARAAKLWRSGELAHRD